MKKLIALLMAAMMLFSCAALAEETTDLTDTEIAALDNQDVVDFDIVMDKLPEGIVMSKETVDHVVYCTFSPEDTAADGAVYIVSVGYADEFDGQTLTGDMTGEQMKQAMDMLSEGYNDPTVELLETEHGTKVFFISENGADTDYAELVTVYKGYIINMFYYKNTDLTEEDDAVAMQIISDMWVI